MSRQKQTERRSAAARREQILHALDAGPRTIKQLVEVTGLTGTSVILYCKAMRKDGLTRATTWIRPHVWSRTRSSYG